ncbi:MAG TPA: HWE histidine kinase domain-containing protein [Pseudolabrys sp.]|jgi:PAS domain S-box-containing protein|nr:HWE histidine kinase domain-containing protein [Pseudolabrys sp.]
MSEFGFLESELEWAVATFEQTVSSDNVVSIEAARSRSTLREHERRFRELLDALPAAVYTTDAAGRITYFNEAAATLWGHRPSLGTSEWCGSWKLFWPDGTPLAHDQCPMALALKEDRTVRGMEATAERPDGTRVPFIPYPTPIHDQTGKLVGAVNMLVDITDRKHAEERQVLLVRELHHRVKNTLATVQAIMGSTARAVDNIEDFKSALFGRIQSLSKTHLLLADDQRAVNFDHILRSELDAFDDGSTKRIVLSGPEVPLSSQVALSLGMAIHELTTNAAKFGALSIFGGRVEVNWCVTIDATRHTLVFDWVESGGPPVVLPLRQGFGSRLLAFVLPGQIQAKTQIDYAPEGVRIRCTLPLPASTPA